MSAAEAADWILLKIAAELGPDCRNYQKALLRALGRLSPPAGPHGPSGRDFAKVSRDLRQHLLLGDVLAMGDPIRGQVVPIPAPSWIELRLTTDGDLVNRSGKVCRRKPVVRFADLVRLEIAESLVPAAEVPTAEAEPAAKVPFKTSIMDAARRRLEAGIAKSEARAEARGIWADLASAGGGPSESHVRRCLADYRKTIAGPRA